MSTLRDKRDALVASIHGYGNVVVAYSGGVDSTYLAAMAHDVLGARSLAVTAVSPAVARRELAGAVALAEGRGWQHQMIDTHELERESYVRNESDRCYWCKTELLEVLGPIAISRAATIVVGTNMDDLGDHRPGITAGAERGAQAPFVEAGLTKQDIRVLSAELGLPTADKPASPCLASRLAYGVRVSAERLRRVEAAEEVLRAHGFVELRVRDHGDLARIEVTPNEIERVAALRAEISSELRGLGFKYVALDLMGFRSGSLNEVLPPPTLRP